MSGKLDQSLDQIMKDTKPAGGRGRGRPRPARKAKSNAKAAIATPAGGIKKNTATARAPRSTAAAAITANATGDSKIIVSNLPEDVTETQIKDYFGKTVGHVKKVFLTYGPQGRSRGVAQIIFAGPTSGPQAAKQLDGVKVDNRAMKIEVVLGAKQAPAPPAPKTLADRVAPSKNAAKEKGKPKVNGATTTTTTGAGKKSTRGKKSGSAGRPKKKTAEELDAEMMDYFGGDSGAANGTVQPAAATTGDTGMVDEVL